MNKKLILLALAIFICSISTCCASEVNVSEDSISDLAVVSVSDISEASDSTFNRQEHINNPESYYLPGFDGYYYENTNNLYLSNGEVVSIKGDAVVQSNSEIVTPDGKVYNRYAVVDDEIGMNSEVTLSLPLNDDNLLKAMSQHLLFAKLGDSYYRLVAPENEDDSQESMGTEDLPKLDNVIGLQSPVLSDNGYDVKNIQSREDEQQGRNIANAAIESENDSNVNGVDTNVSGDVSMQSTGIPVAILIVALMLSVIGFRRKD